MVAWERLRIVWQVLYAYLFTQYIDVTFGTKYLKVFKNMYLENIVEYCL